jgi:truncated hemoglobin YjbI
VSVPSALAHRGFLPEGSYTRGDFAPGIDGATIAALVDGLYDRIELDPALRRLFGHHMENERAGQKRFFGEWLGTGSAYSETAYFPLKHRHDLFPITPALAEQWLEHFHASLEAALPDGPPRRAISEKTRRLALALVNDGEPPSAIRARSHGTCLRYKPAIDSLEIARRGDLTGLQTLLERTPDVLASQTHAARLLHLAALNGRIDVVESLLDRGVDVNKPSEIGSIGSLIFVTPLCAARLRRRKDVEALLLSRGAREDIFTHAFLGQMAYLDEELALAQASDPAVDVLEITPVHHAVAGEQVEALRRLVSAPRPLRNGARALREAARRQNLAMVRVLIERGAVATSIGAGRWVLHPELARVLMGAGATVGRRGEWIGLACTGNQARKDDPEFVAALLRFGARVDDRRMVGQDNDGGRATALHYAAKAGLANTIAVLLDNGADPTARDDNGCTPLDWLERSAKSVDREKVRRLLTRAQVEPVPPARKSREI